MPPKVCNAMAAVWAFGASAPPSEKPPPDDGRAADVPGASEERFVAETRIDIKCALYG
jgi:hypothetical protein